MLTLSRRFAFNRSRLKAISLFGEFRFFAAPRNASQNVPRRPMKLTDKSTPSQAVVKRKEYVKPVKSEVLYDALDTESKQIVDEDLLASLKSSESPLEKVLFDLGNTGFRVNLTTTEIHAPLSEAILRLPVSPQTFFGGDNVLVGLSNIGVLFKSLSPAAQKHLLDLVNANSDCHQKAVMMKVKHLGEMNIPWSALNSAGLETGLQKCVDTLTAQSVAKLVNRLSRMEVAWDQLQVATRKVLSMRLASAQVVSELVTRKLLYNLALLTFDSAENSVEGSGLSRVHEAVLAHLLAGPLCSDYKLSASVGTYLAALQASSSAHREKAGACLSHVLRPLSTIPPPAVLRSGLRLSESVSVVPNVQLLPHPTIPLKTFAAYRVSADSPAPKVVALITLGDRDDATEYSQRRTRLRSALLRHHYPHLEVLECWEHSLLLNMVRVYLDSANPAYRPGRLSRQQIRAKIAENGSALTTDETMELVNSLLPAGVDCNGNTDDAALCLEVFRTFLQIPEASLDAQAVVVALSVFSRCSLSLRTTLPEEDIPLLNAKLVQTITTNSKTHLATALRTVHSLRLLPPPSLIRNSLAKALVSLEPLPDNDAAYMLHCLHLAQFTCTDHDSAITERLFELLEESLTEPNANGSSVADFAHVLPDTTLRDLPTGVRESVLKFVETRFTSLDVEDQLGLIYALGSMRVEFDSFSPALQLPLLSILARPIGAREDAPKLLAVFLRMQVKYPGLVGSVRPGFDSRLVASLRTANKNWKALPRMASELAMCGFALGPHTDPELLRTFSEAVGACLLKMPEHEGSRAAVLDLVACLRNMHWLYSDLAPQAQRCLTELVAVRETDSKEFLLRLLKLWGEVAVPWTALHSPELEECMQRALERRWEGDGVSFAQALAGLHVPWDSLSASTRRLLVQSLVNDVHQIHDRLFGTLLHSLALMTHDSAWNYRRSSNLKKLHSVVCNRLLEADYRCDQYKLACSIGTYMALLQTLPLHRERAGRVVQQLNLFFKPEQGAEDRLSERVSVVYRPSLLPFVTLPLATWAAFEAPANALREPKVVALAVRADANHRNISLSSSILGYYFPGIELLSCREGEQAKVFREFLDL